MSRSQEWIKLHSRDLADPVILTLSWAQRAIWYALKSYSKQTSETPGLFVRDGRPMTAGQLALALGRSADDRRLILKTLDRLSDADIALITHNPADGFECANWDAEQSGTATEGREAWRLRKQRQRERQRRDDARARRNVAAGAKVTPLRPQEPPR